MLKFLYRILCGFFLGISALAPGISGSIVAIIVGVYHDLLEAFSSPFRDFKKSLLLLVPICLGVAVSIVFFVLVFSMIFERFEKAAYLLFAGLIAGNLPIVLSEVRKYEVKKYVLKKSNYLIIAIALIITFAVGMLAFSDGQALRTEAVTAGLPLVAVGGFSSGAALLVPGMSFSMILILTGIYGQLIYAARELVQFNTDYLLWIGVFVVAVVAGLALASKLIKAAFNKYPAAANSAVLGFMLGSFFVLLVEGFRVVDVNFVWWHGIVAGILGLGISILFVFLLRIINKDKR